MPYVYIVECKDGTLYTGWTLDVEKRIEQHNLQRGAKYTRFRCPVFLKYWEHFVTKEEALAREREIKKLPRKKKKLLTNGLSPAVTASANSSN
ncbi:MAG: GIY-YIG nuclease family protein [bacterium]|nr:GIY-YIG nuclease family protein [bacterium]